MELDLEPREVYGKILYYPLNEPAKAILAVAGRKTFAVNDLRILKNAGFGINVILKRDEFCANV